jgi:hypothetical protein
MLRRKFERKKEEVAEGWRKLLNEGLQVAISWSICTLL